MLEASAVATAMPSLWSAFNSWFTPAVLFLLLNLMIATIALTSSLTPTNPPSHDMHGYPQEQQPPQERQQQQQQQDEGEEGSTTTATTKQSPSISILDRVKSLGLFSPGKSPQKKDPPPLIPPEEFNSQTNAASMTPFEKQGLGQPGSHSPVGRFEAFDIYGYLPQESPSEVSRDSNPAHYIFEPTHPQEVLLSPQLDEKVEGHGEAEDGDAEEKEEEVESREGDGYEKEREKEAPNLLLRRGIQRSESLNVKFSFSNLGDEEGRGGSLDEGLEKQRPATVKEGKGKWGGSGGGVSGGDEEVDARADDFINRFKQQLKLQRMDSLARQKDLMMINKVRSF